MHITESFLQKNLKLSLLRKQSFIIEYPMIFQLLNLFFLLQLRLDNINSIIYILKNLTIKGGSKDFIRSPVILQH